MRGVPREIPHYRLRVNLDFLRQTGRFWDRTIIACKTRVPGLGPRIRVYDCNAELPLTKRGFKMLIAELLERGEIVLTAATDELCNEYLMILSPAMLRGSWRAKSLRGLHTSNRCSCWRKLNMLEKTLCSLPLNRELRNQIYTLPA